MVWVISVFPADRAGFFWKVKIHNYMSTFKDRLLEEKAQLDERGNKLETFIKSEKFDSVTKVQQTLLKIQLQAMVTYGQCLMERITWLDNEVIES